jgi:hypothetical protein
MGEKKFTSKVQGSQTSERLASQMTNITGTEKIWKNIAMVTEFALCCSVE